MNTRTGRIYQLKNLITNELYVGSTFDTLQKRNMYRKSNYRKWLEGNSTKAYDNKLYSSIFEYGWEAFVIELLQEVEVKSKQDLHKLEGEWIRKLNTYHKGLNSQLQNRTQKEIKEYRRSYFNANRDRILAINKIYREKNKELIKQRFKIYYQKNCEKIKSRQKNYRLKKQKKVNGSKIK